MTTNLSYLIAYISSHSVVIPLLIAAFRWRYLRGSLLLFALFEAFSLGFAIYSALTFSDGNNSYLEFISLSVDVVMMSLIFGPLMPTAAQRIAVRVGGVLFVAGILADYIWGEGLKKIGASYAASLELMLVTATILVYLSTLLKQHRESLRRYPMAVISCGMVFINLICLPVYLFGPTLMNYSMTLTLRTYDLMYLSGIIVQLGYGYAFWLTKATSSDRFMTIA